MKLTTVLCALAFVLVAAGGSSAQQLTITPVDGGGQAVTAQFNPKELSIDKQVQWTHKKRSPVDTPPLEFAGGEARSMSFELMFDTFESGEDLNAVYITPLTALSVIDASLHRPTRVKVKWGTLPEFEGVIESLSVRYTLFLPDGTPARATCSVKVKEATTAIGR